MFGQNPRRNILQGDGDFLEIHSIFKTIQGEGTFVGVPAIFIRLGGCNLSCKFCDTEFEGFTLTSLKNVLHTVDILSKNSTNVPTVQLVVITGGEPFRQPIEQLCQRLLDKKFQVQIETNGTLYRKLPDKISIICSPKAGNKGYHKIRQDLLPYITAFKFIISNNIPQYNHIEEVGQSTYNTPVFVQPMDQNDYELNKANNKLAIQIALEKNYRLSLQVHKILGIE